MSTGTGSGPAAVEVELVHETRRPPYVQKPWRMLEIWTQNRIYALDSAMRCLEVVDQATGKRAEDHTLLGAHLVGGQRREGDTVHLCHPFPQPGTEAVFEQGTAAGARFSHSSTVTRVVLRLRTLTIDPGLELPNWSQVCGDRPK